MDWKKFKVKTASKKPRTVFKKLKKGKNFFVHPERLLKLPSVNYSPEYLRQLPYRIKKRYGEQPK